MVPMVKYWNLNSKLKVSNITIGLLLKSI